MAIVLDNPISDRTDNPFFPYHEQDLNLQISDDDLAFPLETTPPGPVISTASVDPPDATQDVHTAPNGRRDVFATATSRFEDALAPEDAPDDMSISDEEDMDDNASDSSSNLTEVRSCEFPAYFKEHAGRLFHFHGISPYPLPVDGYEWKRLDAIHIVLRQILGRNYDGPVAEVLAPDGLERPKMVVDLCNGTGLWVMDMAREFSHVQFRGLDLVPIATQYPLDNVRFELADVTQRLRFANNSVDFVHARMTSLGVHDYPKLLREVARVLRPGGLFLSCEFGAYAALHPDHPSHANPAEYIPHTARFYRAVTDGIDKGVPAIALRVPNLIRQNGAFCEPVEKRRAFPVGTPYSSEAYEASLDDRFRAPPAPFQLGHPRSDLDVVGSVFHRIAAAYAIGLAGHASAELAYAYSWEVQRTVGQVSVLHSTWARKL